MGWFTGLFKRAISQSGTNLAAWARPAQDGVAVRRAEKLASLVGCPKGANSWAETLNCIRKVDGDTITKQFYEFFVSVVNVFDATLCVKHEIFI